MYLFVDTEFVPSKDGQHLLLSIGLCGPRDEEFYAEHEVQLPTHVDPFISGHVLPQLGRSGCLRGTRSEMGYRLLRWLRQFQGQPIELCYDFHADGQAVEELLALTQPEQGIPICYCHVAYLLDDPAGVAAAEACWDEVSRTRGMGRHHALADALALRARFNAVHGSEPQPAAVSRPSYAEVKCAECGWVHASISMATALANSDSHEQLARYFQCYRCNSPSSAFVPACPEDAPSGCSLQPVVVRKVPHNARDGEDRNAS